MIKDLCYDNKLLSRKGEVVTENDLDIVNDLIDSFKHYNDIAIGMSASLIGYNKNVIIFKYLFSYLVMINPQIISKSDAYKVEERSIVKENMTLVKRYKTIKVRYQDLNFKYHEKEFKDMDAEVIQHEIDLTKGKLL